MRAFFGVAAQPESQPRMHRQLCRWPTQGCPAPAHATRGEASRSCNSQICPDPELVVHYLPTVLPAPTHELPLAASPQ